MLTNFPNTFTLLQIHIGDSYSTTWGNARWTFYAGTGTPTAWFDGVRSAVGASSTQQAYNTYLGHYNVRRATPTDVTIGLTGTQISGPMYTFRARVGVEAGGTSKTMRIHIAQVRDRYPSSPSYSRSCFRQAAAYQDVTVAAGQFALCVRRLPRARSDICCTVCAGRVDDAGKRQIPLAQAIPKNPDELASYLR